MELKKSLHISPDVEKKLTNKDRENIERFTEDLFNTIKEKFNSYGSLGTIKNKVKTVYISFYLGYEIKGVNHFDINGNKGFYFGILSADGDSDIDEDEIIILRTSLPTALKNETATKNKISDFIIKYEDNFTIVIGLDKELKLPEQSTNKKASQQEDGLTVFVPMEPIYSFENIILEEETKEELDKVLNMIYIRHKLYEEWGFKKIDPVPRMILNFYGPPGTGKTTTAHAIAKKLGKKILALNYAEIESKYVGDAPKNLVRAFETAHKENAVLFFDEADSFLGKRITSVNSSSDQAVNSLRSQMIILLDSFPDMIIIFSTNLLNNYDRAFESRIFKHIKFDLPKKENRVKIIKQMIPEEVPFENNQRLTEEQLNELAEILEGFSGREIKNAVLDTLLSVLFEGRDSVRFEDFKKSFIKAKEAKEKLEQEYKSNTLDPLKKKEIEEKIKNALKQQNQSETQSSTEIQLQSDKEENVANT